MFLKTKRYSEQELEEAISSGVKINWRTLCMFQRVSVDFIRKHQDIINWKMISIHQYLSEEFIEEFAHKVKWIYICLFQKLTKDFIRKMIKFVDWQSIAFRQLDFDEDKDFINEFDKELTKRDSKNKFKFWSIKGKYHRIIGPAIVRDENNVEEWWYKGEKIDCVKSQKDFERWLKFQILNF
jgi:phosphoribosylanthranilate isomerase